MRVRIHRSPGESDVLEHDVDVPAEVATENGEAWAWWVRRHPTEPVVVVTFEELAAVFDAHTGERIWTPPVDGVAADIAFTRNGSEVLVLYAYAKHPDGDAKAKRVGLRRFDWKTRAPLEELYFDDTRMRYPPRAIVVDEQERRCIVTTSYCAEQTYEVIDLESPMRLRSGFGLPKTGYDGAFSVDPPTFSRDARRIVSIDARESWWEEDGCLGRVLIHDLETNTLEECAVFADLPEEGWQPENPDDPRRSGLWLPRFLSDAQVEVTLPNGIRHVIGLPLPRELRIALRHG